MEQSHTPSISELKKELEHIDERTREKCVLCRVVLGFALIIFIAVAIYAAFQFDRKQHPKTIPLDPKLYPPTDPAVSAREIRELGSVLHPELSSTTPPLPTSSPKILNKTSPR